MNAKHLVAAFAVFAATGSVFAQTPADVTFNVRDGEYPIIEKSGTPKTRAEVAAEIAQARANGTLDITDTTYPALPATAVSKTRAEVLAELDQYRKAHPNGETVYASGD